MGASPLSTELVAGTWKFLIYSRVNAIALTVQIRRRDFWFYAYVLLLGNVLKVSLLDGLFQTAGTEQSLVILK